MYFNIFLINEKEAMDLKEMEGFGWRKEKERTV